MICAVIPAAGRGTRLGAGGPKIFLPLGHGRRLWDLLTSRLAPHVDRIHVVLSREGMDRARARLDAGGPSLSASIQDPPRGMGDAIFGARAAFADADTLLVVWGDQASLSERTVARTLEAHALGRGARITLPLVSVERPYVDYVFDEEGRLVRVQQSREGEVCRERGFADVGVFCLSGSGLADAWDAYASSPEIGRATGELNFLPFLAHLSRVGYGVTRVEVEDPGECRGINDAADLLHFQGQGRAP